MNLKIKNRVIDIADYILASNKTIREVAKVYKVSKSTVHKDLHERLAFIDINKYKEVDKILKYHISIRHIKGGESTRKHFLYMNKLN